MDSHCNGPGAYQYAVGVIAVKVTKFPQDPANDQCSVTKSEESPASWNPVQPVHFTQEGGHHPPHPPPRTIPAVKTLIPRPESEHVN